MTARWTLRGLAACLALAGPLPDLDVRVERGAGIERLDAVVPGRLVGYALPSAPDGRRGVVVLVRPVDFAKEKAAEERKTTKEKEDENRMPPCPEEPAENGPAMRLYRIDPADGETVLLADDLPGDCAAVDVADLDGDGWHEVLLARPGELWRVDPRPRPEDRRAAPVRLLEEPHLDWRQLHPRAVRNPELDGEPLVAVLRPGGLRLFGPRDAAESWAMLAEIALPLEGDVRPGSLRLRTRVPEFLGRGPDGRLVFATSPERFGSERLRMLRIEIMPAGEAEVTECWARLPSPENVLEHHYMMLDGRPSLLVTTKPSDKLALFGEKRLRLFPLERDRSRLGVAPLFATESRMNIWQEGTPGLIDVNGDGVEDLVIGYWKGLRDSRVVLDAYVRRSDGTLDTAARTTAFDVDDGDRDFVEYGADLDGDGVADLLLRNDDGGLLMFPGLPSADAKRLVERKPRTFPMDDLDDDDDRVVVTVSTAGTESSRLGELRSRPHPVDLDGDGRPELVTAYRGSRTRPGVLRVVRLAGRRGP